MDRTNRYASSGLSRRDALQLLGLVGAGVMVPAPGRSVVFAAGAQAPAPAASRVVFPKGSVLRTIVKDIPPESLTGGATLFHEHFSIDLPPVTPPPPTGPNVPADAGLRQLDVLESVGAKPQRVVIGHTCCLDDPKANIIKQIAKRGAWVGFDRVTGGRVPDDGKVTMLLAFLDAGFADQLLLSSDLTGRRTEARPGYGNTVTVFAPKLRRAGVKDEVVRAILQDNPRRFLAFVPKA